MSDLDDFQHKLDASRASDSEEAEKQRSANGLSLAMKLGTELLAGVLVGAGLGWALDRWLGTEPWLLLACLFLGIASGVLNMIRTVERLDKQENSGTNTGL